MGGRSGGGGMKGFAGGYGESVLPCKQVKIVLYFLYIKNFIHIYYQGYATNILSKINSSFVLGIVESGNTLKNQ